MGLDTVRLGLSNDRYMKKLVRWELEDNPLVPSFEQLRGGYIPPGGLLRRHTIRTWCVIMHWEQGNPGVGRRCGPTDFEFDQQTLALFGFDWP